MRVVIVGASSGLGRCVGVGLAREGHRVALLARRVERLAAAVQEAGPSAFAVACDVTEEQSCRSSIEEAAAGLGGIDALVYATGVGHLGRLADIGADTWGRVLATNVTGAALVTATAMPHLVASRGTAIYLSSISASETPPWPGLGAYIVSKAALNKLVEAWREEYPVVGFTRISVGETLGGEGEGGSEFSGNWDPELAGELLPDWMARRFITGALLDVERLVDAVRAVLALGSGASVPSIVVAPRVAETPGFALSEVLDPGSRT